MVIKYFYTRLIKWWLFYKAVINGSTLIISRWRVKRRKVRMKSKLSMQCKERSLIRGVERVIASFTPNMDFFVDCLPSHSWKKNEGRKSYTSKQQILHTFVILIPQNNNNIRLNFKFSLRSFLVTLFHRRSSSACDLWLEVTGNKCVEKSPSQINAQIKQRIEYVVINITHVYKN